MKIYGYHKEDQKEPSELSEVTFVAEPSKLRKIATFLSEAADELENDQTISHLHFQDSQGAVSGEDPDLIVYWE